MLILRGNGHRPTLRALLKKREIEARPLSLEELVDEVVMLIRANGVNRHVSIVLDLPRDLPLMGGDRIHLQQVLLNLLINGMDALAITAAEDRSLALRARREGLGFVPVAVSDNGPGIPEAQLSRLFEPLSTAKPQGMGLGLPISRTVIEAHGGRLWAENNPGGGAIFRFTLPIADGGIHEPNSVSS